MSTLRVCLADMNNGHPNQATRCFRVIAEAFFRRVREKNPGLEPSLLVVEPRNRHEIPPPGCDFYLASGGPGTPFEHDGEPWLDELYAFFDGLVEGAIKSGPAAPSLFGVCYTFELLIRHFGVADMVLRNERKFGVMPVYMTDEGQHHPLTEAFRDRLFAFEHRNWEAINLDEARLRTLGGKLLARESRDGVSKGHALLALDFAPGVQGTQFHPEADRQGVISWVAKREHAQAFVDAYGPLTYDRMINTLDNPDRLAKTFALLIPGWLTRKFNAMAPYRGWAPLDPPLVKMEAFAGDAPPAATIRYKSLARMPSAPPAAMPTAAEGLPDASDTGTPVATARPTPPVPVTSGS